LHASEIPLLASPQGGVGASSRTYREATEADAAGVVFLSCAIGKPPRPRHQSMLRGIFLLARPPLLAAMQGGESRSPETQPSLQPPPERGNAQYMGLPILPLQPKIARCVSVFGSPVSSYLF